MDLQEYSIEELKNELKRRRAVEAQQKKLEKEKNALKNNKEQYIFWEGIVTDIFKGDSIFNYEFEIYTDFPIRYTNRFRGFNLFYGPKFKRNNIPSIGDTVRLRCKNTEDRFMVKILESKIVEIIKKRKCNENEKI